MAKVAITILAETADDFMARIERIKPFAKRIHIDVTDGVFTDSKSLAPAQLYGIDGTELDIHMMVEHPLLGLETIIALEPRLVICHFEAAAEDLHEVSKQLKAIDIRFGLALRSETTIDEVADWLPHIDHLMIYTGSSIGHNSVSGSDFNLNQLDKITAAKAINPNLEVGVDGGIDQSTAKLAIEGGADVLDVGSFIHNSPDPEMAYEAIRAIAEGEV